ncbi:MAG: copper chaperone PCu(A)C, partial [Pseudomonadales bacterium]
MRHYFIATFIALLITGCAKQPLSVSDAYVRAPVAQRDVTAAFMAIANSCQVAIKLLGANSPAAKQVE